MSLTHVNTFICLQLHLILSDVINVKKMNIMKKIVDDKKCAGNVVKKILAITWMNVSLPINVLIMVVTIRSMQDPVKVGEEKRKFSQ